MNYVGSELSKEQVEYANEHLHKVVIIEEKIPNVIEEVNVIFGIHKKKERQIVGYLSFRKERIHVQNSQRL